MSSCFVLSLSHFIANVICVSVYVQRASSHSFPRASYKAIKNIRGTIM